MSYGHVFMDLVTSSNATNVGNIALGTFRWVASTRKGYRRIAMAAGESLAANDLGYHNAATTGDWTIYDDLTTGKRNGVAGVATATQTAAYYGWLQTKGECTVKKLSGAGNNWVIGDLVIPSATAKAAIQEDAGTAPTYRPIGVCIATAASTAVTGTVLLFLDP